MDENHRDKTESKLIATENKSQLPPFSPEDEKEAQKELDRLRKRLRENENSAVNVTRKLNRKRTGFEDKTFWDWLNLLGVLAIPLVVVGATIAFGLLQTHLADLQHANDQKLAQQQHQSDQQQALDQQRQATLVTYLDDMNNLLLNRGLLTSKPSDEIRVTARTETLSAMRQLDGKRNRFLVQFLQDAHLIGLDFNTGKDHNIVNFENADLSSDDLSGANLIHADLSHATLSGANLTDADLTNADLNDADLNYAILTSADLNDADLNYAEVGSSDLTDADLSGAYLEGAILDGADLTSAHLNDADFTNASFIFVKNLTQDQLDTVYSCRNADLEDLICLHNL